MWGDPGVFRSHVILKFSIVAMKSPRHGREKLLKYFSRTGEWYVIA
jgi:hypothetical protein